MSGVGGRGGTFIRTILRMKGGRNNIGALPLPLTARFQVDHVWSAFDRAYFRTAKGRRSHYAAVVVSRLYVQDVGKSLRWVWNARVGRDEEKASDGLVIGGSSPALCATAFSAVTRC